MIKTPLTDQMFFRQDSGYGYGFPSSSKDMTVLFGTGAIPASVDEFLENLKGHEDNSSLEYAGIISSWQTSRNSFVCEADGQLYESALTPKNSRANNYIPGYADSVLNPGTWEIYNKRTVTSDTLYADLSVFDLPIETKQDDNAYICPDYTVETGISTDLSDLDIKQYGANMYYYIDAGQEVDVTHLNLHTPYTYYSSGRYYNSIDDIYVDVWDEDTGQFVQLVRWQNQYNNHRYNPNTDLLYTLPVETTGRYFRLRLKRHGNYGSLWLRHVRLICTNEPAIQEPSQTIDWAAVIFYQSDPEKHGYEAHKPCAILTDDIGLIGSGAFICLESLTLEPGTKPEGLVFEKTFKLDRSV